MVARCISRPNWFDREAWKRRRSWSNQGCRSIPIERMFRTIWSWDSSNARYRQRSPRAHVACAKCAATLLLPLPAVPETSTVLPR